MSLSTIECLECGTIIKLKNGKYKCPNCGFEVDEDSYFEVDSNGNLITEEWQRYEDEDDIPEGCIACGGDYPRCTESCPMYD